MRADTLKVRLRSTTLNSAQPELYISVEPHFRPEEKINSAV